MSLSQKKFLLFLLCSIFGWPTLRAGAVEAVLRADAHVNSARPGANSGTISNLNVGGGYSTLLRFDLGTLPAGTSASQVSRALLRLYCNRVDIPGQINLGTVRAPWGEYTVTFDSMPATDATTQSASVTQGGAYVWIDVTSIVQGWVTSPTGNNGLVLSADAAAVQFDSKENDLTAHAPLLEVVIVSQGPKGDIGATGASGIQGVQGPPGATGAIGPVGATGPQGLQGLQGPKGDAGPAGPQGVPGPQGAQGLQGQAGTTGPAGLSYRGAYAAATTYAAGDVVTLQGTSYVSLSSSNRGNTPSSSAGQWSVLAAQGATGPPGEAGATGASGAIGPQGPAGAAGPAGPPVSFRGTWNGATAYSVGDAVSYSGSSYIAISAGSGQTPGSSPSYWSLLAQAGITGGQGPQGLQGPPGISFKGTWLNTTGYLVNDAVFYNGSTYLALATNYAVLPGSAPLVWGLLAQGGDDGATGPSGTAATIAIGAVTTGPAGSAAAVTNSGSSSAAVLNFVIPQGVQGVPGTAGGGGGGGGTSLGVVHAVSFTLSYYSVSSASSASSETDAILTWVPSGCTASQLAVYSRQSNRVTATLRTGTPGSMTDTALSCAAASGGSCFATGSVAIPANAFVDLSITGSSGTQGSVWTALTCN